MKQSFIAICVICSYSCVAVHGQEGFFGRLKQSVVDNANIDRTLTPAQQEQQGQQKALEKAKKAWGLKCRTEADALVNKLKVENRDATPDELYIVARGLSFNIDGSKVSCKDMLRIVMPDYYAKSARAGNSEALLFLLQAYGLGFGYINDIIFDQLEQDDARFEEICALQLEKFPGYKVHSKEERLKNIDERLQKMVDRVCEKNATKKLKETARIAAQQAEKEAQRTAIEKQEQDKALRDNELVAQQKAIGDTLSSPKIKYPKADVFKSHIKLYKDFESGVSYQWAVAKLQKDGVGFEKGTPSVFFGSTLTFSDEKNRVLLAFASETNISENPEGVLAIALVELPKDISHETALKKYKDLFPKAEIKRETETKNVESEPTMLDNGMILIKKYASLNTTDTIICENVKIEIASSVLVGKAYYARNIASPMTLFFELLPDGGYKKGDNVSPDLELAIPLLVSALKAKFGQVNIVITDNVIEKMYGEIKKNADFDVKKKATEEKAKKDAAALNF